MKTTYLRINPADNVAVAISPLHAGETIEADGRVITLRTDVPAGHKVTLKNFQAGENIIKYGYPIGHVTVDVPEGTWVSEKEIKTNLAGLLDYTYQPVEVHTDIPMEHRMFKGYRRRNGDVGVRNEIWIIPTVGCVNGIVNQLAEGLRRETDGGKGVDAIVAFPHNYGCSQLGEDHENTKKILRDMVLHPNAGAVLVVGLGCENNQPDHYMMLMEFEGGVTVNFSIEAFTSYGGRRTRIMGTRGDIVGDMEEFTHTDFATGVSKTYNANAEDALNYEGVGHGGGDAGMIRDWIEAIRRQDASLMSTPLDESLESHLIAFAAERSRKEGKVISLSPLRLKLLTDRFISAPYIQWTGHSGIT